jgi:hypothetical protein
VLHKQFLKLHLVFLRNFGDMKVMKLAVASERVLLVLNLSISDSVQDSRQRIS